MPKLQCDICGGSIVMQPGGQLAVCDSCGMQYSTGRIREKVQEIRGTVSVEGTVQTQDADFIIRGGVLTRYNGNDVHVTIPDTVVEIGEQAFYDCAGIQSVKMSQSVTRIRSNAFGGCRSLRDIELSKSLIEIDNWAFSRCAALKRILLPDTLITLGGSAFSGCISLESINIPDSVQTSGQWSDLRGTFENCPTLKEVHISEQQLNTLFIYKYYNGEFYIRNGIFETDEIGDKNCGPWYLNLKHVIEAANKKIADRKADWRKSGLCQYCGAKFTGGPFSEKKCSQCGKPKDY